MGMAPGGASLASSRSSSSSLTGAFGNRSGPRSRGGCWTCREKKVKCDETRPRCKRCDRLSRNCDYNPRPRKRPRRKAESVVRPAGNSHGDELVVATTELNQPTQTYADENSGMSGDENRLQPLADAPGSPSSACSFGGIEEADDQGSMALRKESDAITLSGLSPSCPSACGLILTEFDHHAIRHYRTSFSAMQHTKNPRFSVLSIIFRFAEINPMVMHMVIAVAGYHLAYLKSEDNDDMVTCKSAVNHYCEAMRLMGEAVADQINPTSLDEILATLWLMLVYEQRFSDDGAQGVAHHLKGAASILKVTSPRLLPEIAAQRESVTTDRDDVIIQTKQQQPRKVCEPVSYFTSRMIKWISCLDASAASYGLGGPLNQVITQLGEGYSDNDGQQKATVPLMRVFSTINRHSDPLFRSFWGNSYPQSELVDDLQNRCLFSLYEECGQLRFLNAELAWMYQSDADRAMRRAKMVETAITMVGEKYAEFLLIAAALKIGDMDNSRFVSNARFIVSHYHAAVLDFYRITKFDQPLDERQRTSSREIVTLSSQGYRDEGIRAIFLVAWPLFMAGLEIDDLIHQQWVLDRFKDLAKFGKNYRRAYRLLEIITRDQERYGRRMKILDYLHSSDFERFVI